MSNSYIDGGKGSKTFKWKKFRKRWKKDSEDEIPSRLPMAKYLGWSKSEGGKSTIYRKLERFLQKNIGRPYNDVYSEWCKRYKDIEIRRLFTYKVNNEACWQYWRGYYIDDDNNIAYKPGFRKKDYRRRCNSRSYIRDTEDPNRIQYLIENEWWEVVWCPADGQRFIPQTYGIEPGTKEWFMSIRSQKFLEEGLILKQKYRVKND